MNVKKILNSGVLLWVFSLLLAVFGLTDGSAMTADTAVVNPDGGGVISVGDPNYAGVTETFTREEYDDLIRKEFEKHVILKRPERLPLMALVRHAGASRSWNSRIVNDTALGTKAGTVSLTTALAETELQAPISVSDPKIVCIGQTLIAGSVKGYMEDGVTVSALPLVLYVIDKDANGLPIVKAQNGSGANHDTIPAIPADEIFNLAGTAATERQARGYIHTSIPTGQQYFLQKFDQEVQTSEEWIQLLKNVDWGVPDQVEDALYEMHRRMERSYLIGVQLPVRLGHNKYYPVDENLYFCQGLWWQAKNEFDFGNTFTIDQISGLAEKMFKGNIGSKNRVMLCGTGLLMRLQNIEGYNKVIYLDEKRKQFNGLNLTVRDLVTVMGSMTLIHLPSFDDMSMNGQSMTDCGIWLDPTHLTEYSIGGMRSNPLDLKGSGQALAEGTYFYQISALIDRYPETGGRVWANAAGA